MGKFAGRVSWFFFLTLHYVLFLNLSELAFYLVNFLTKMINREEVFLCLMFFLELFF